MTDSHDIAEPKPDCPKTIGPMTQAQMADPKPRYCNCYVSGNEQWTIMFDERSQADDKKQDIYPTADFMFRVNVYPKTVQYSNWLNPFCW